MTQLAIRENWFEDLVAADWLARGYGAGALSVRFGASSRGLGG